MSIRPSGCLKVLVAPRSLSFEISRYLCGIKCRYWPLSSRQGHFRDKLLCQYTFTTVFPFCFFEDASREAAKIPEPCWFVILGSWESRWLILTSRWVCPVYSVHQCMILHWACPRAVPGFYFLFFHMHIKNKDVFYDWLCAKEVSVYGHVHVSAEPTEFGRILYSLEFKFKTFMYSLTSVLGNRLRALEEQQLPLLSTSPIQSPISPLWTSSFWNWADHRKRVLLEGAMQASKGGKQPRVLPALKSVNYNKVH